MQTAKNTVIDTSVIAELMGSHERSALRDMFNLYLRTESETPALLRKYAVARDGENLGRRHMPPKALPSLRAPCRCRDFVERLRKASRATTGPKSCSCHPKSMWPSKTCAVLSKPINFITSSLVFPASRNARSVGA